MLDLWNDAKQQEQFITQSGPTKLTQLYFNSVDKIMNNTKDLRNQ